MSLSRACFMVCAAPLKDRALVDWARPRGLGRGSWGG
jgi:hypothetical protein